MKYDEEQACLTYTPAGLTPIGIDGTQRMALDLEVQDATGHVAQSGDFVYSVRVADVQGWGLHDGHRYTIMLFRPWICEKNHMRFDAATLRFTFSPPAPPPLTLPEPDCIGSPVEVTVRRGSQNFRVRIVIDRRTWSQANQEYARWLRAKWQEEWRVGAVPLVTKKNVAGVKVLTDGSVEIKQVGATNRLYTAVNQRIGDGAVWAFEHFSDKS